MLCHNDVSGETRNKPYRGGAYSADPCAIVGSAKVSLHMHAWRANVRIMSQLAWDSRPEASRSAADWTKSCRMLVKF